MQRDRLIIEEMIASARRAIELVGDNGDDDVASDQVRLDALLWNFTVLGEGASQLPAFVEQLRSVLAGFDGGDE